MVSPTANVKAVQTMLGYKSAAAPTPDVYADPFPDDLEGVASRWNEAIGASRASIADAQRTETK